MAVWAGLGQAATVAQLVGADVGGLISTIMQAALTAHQNKKECEQLARRVFMIAQLLPHLQDPEVMQRPEVRWPLAGLGDTLREAHELVISCQARNAAYQFVMAGRLADKFRDVQSRIDFYISVFPLISHIGISIRLDRIYNVLLPDGTSVPPSPVSQAPQLESAEVAREVPHGAKVFTLAEMEAATNNFALEYMLGETGCSTVYKGMLHDGREVAIRRMKSGRHHAEKVFRTEVAILSPVRHKHIVCLLGECKEQKKRLLSFRKRLERLLVYEYLENRSLYEHLHVQSFSSPVTTSWKMRMEVLLGISRAIEHLHCYAVPSVIHHDIKSSNILLDTNWVPRVKDFGTSVTWDKTNDESQGSTPWISGTLKYLDPEYFQTCLLKPASDVYNFGVVMLEVLTGKEPMGHNSGRYISLASFALPIIEAGELGKVLDRRPAQEPTPRELEAVELVASTAVRCLQMQGKDRAPIPDVVANLETALELVCRNG